MWKPPERIRHPLPDGSWPDQATAARSLLFQPLAHSPLHLEQRTWVPAMVPWRATGEGEVSAEVLSWYERFAKGRPGALVVEATGIRDVPSGPLLRIGDDRFIPGLRRLVETVRRASQGHTRLLIQLIDFLAVHRRPRPETYFQRYLRLTERHRQAVGGGGDETVRERLSTLSDEELENALTPRELESLRYGHRQRVTDTDLDPIRDLPQVLPDLFAAAAGRARHAGFDGVELHYAHAYTMASFLSALNERDDGYGGTLENRMRLPLEVYHRVRRGVGEDFVVGCRYLSRDCVAGGSTLSDAIAFGRRFAAAGMDFLSLSRGGRFEDAQQPRVGWAVYPYTGPSGYECMPTVISDERGPFGRNVDDVARIRQAIRADGLGTPIVVAGGLAGFAQAEEILAAGSADIIGSARQSLADPDWFRKMRLGRGAEVRRCEFTNYCEGLDQKHKQVTCQLWDRVDLEQPGLKLSTDGGRRLTAPSWESGHSPFRERALGGEERES